MTIVPNIKAKEDEMIAPSFDGEKSFMLSFAEYPTPFNLQKIIAGRINISS